MKKVLFDLDDTLYDLMDPVASAFRRLYGEAYPDVDMKKLFALRAHYSNEVFMDTVNGTMSMRDMYIYRIQRACADLGIAMSDEEALRFQDYYADGQSCIQLSETMQKLLADLTAAGCLLGVITNGPADHQRDKLRALQIDRWIPEEYQFISGALGITKPDPEIFRIASEKMGGDISEYIYVGDSYETDIAGAKGAGWKAVWLNRRGKELPEGMQPDYIVHDDTELYVKLTSGT